jgi:uncharacterized protein (TIGR00255 family)
MTAYGRSEQTIGYKTITAEIKSVNHRYFDCTVKISKMYGFLEDKIRSYIQSYGISRGKIDVYIGIDVSGYTDTTVTLNETYTASYINSLFKLRDLFGLKDDISVMTAARNSDIFIVNKPSEDIEKDWLDVLSVLKDAVAAFDAMRVSEGANLKSDLIIKHGNIRNTAKQISEKAALFTDNYRARLETKLRQVLSEFDVEADSARILTECAVFAEKTAVDEELVRLDSHFMAFEKILGENEPVGRKLDFLLQEMNREVNTIGSKANDASVTAYVINAKSELEKIREQVQNIE